MANTFKNNVVWITGASSGYGRAMALNFAGKGANVILSGRDRDALEEVHMSIPGSKILLLDMLKPELFERLTSEAVSLFGRIDIIVHNAGVAQNSLALEISRQAEHDIWQVDYFGVVELMKSVLPHFLERKSGRIVVVSGLLAYINLPGRTAYAAAKAALIAYFGCLRAEIKGSNIGVQVLVPGSLRTNLVNKALSADGSVVNSRREVSGCPLDVAAEQTARVIAKGEKHQAYIGERKGFVMLKMWGLFPNFIINKILSR